MAKTLLLVGGHGAGDPGACGNGKIEFNEARRVNQALYNKLKGKIPVEIYNTGKDLYRTNDHAAYKDYEIIETHFNAFNGIAKGTEVLIKIGFNADALDNAILTAMSKYFNSRGIKQRGDLANMNKFASLGTSYRLIEVCFIDSSDMTVYNSKFDALITDMAKAILKCYGASPSTPASTRTAKAEVRLQTGMDEQRIYFEDAGNGYVRLKNKKTGLYLDVPGAKAENGAVLQWYPHNNTDAQLWKIIWVAQGHAKYLTIAPKLAPDKRISVENNGNNGAAKLKLWDDMHLKESKQNFWIKQAADGTYVLVHTYSLKAITAA